MNIFNLVKLIPLAGDVRKAIKEADGKDFWFLSRKLVGPAVTLIAAYIAYRYGVTIDAEILASITQNAETVISTAAVLWGLVATVRTLFKKKG